MEYRDVGNWDDRLSAAVRSVSVEAGAGGAVGGGGELVPAVERGPVLLAQFDSGQSEVMQMVRPQFQSVCTIPSCSSLLCVFSSQAYLCSSVVALIT